MKSRLIDLTGSRFDRLLVIKRTDDDKNKNRRWLCLCDCGKEKIIHGISLSHGRTRSCGCLQKEIAGKVNTKHGHSGNKSRVYNVWKAMKQRCCNPNNKEYHNYGGRGIKVCMRWQRSFSNFLVDMNNPPTITHQIDRIDNNKGYFNDNCRWITPREQQNNRRNNHLITHNGRTQTLTLWMIETGIQHSTIAARIKRGWSTEDALTIPVVKKRPT